MSLGVSAEEELLYNKFQPRWKWKGFIYPCSSTKKTERRINDRIEGWQTLLWQHDRFNTRSSRADNYNYAMKSDSLSHHLWEERQCHAVTFSGCLTGAISLSQTYEDKGLWSQIYHLLERGEAPGVTSCFYSTSAVSQKRHHCSLHKHYPSHLRLRREVQPGAKEQNTGGRKTGGGHQAVRAGEIRHRCRRMDFD